LALLPSLRDHLLSYLVLRSDGYLSFVGLDDELEDGREREELALGSSVLTQEVRYTRVIGGCGLVASRLHKERMQLKKLKTKLKEPSD
jgi:hypothetical protein